MGAKKWGFRVRRMVGYWPILMEVRLRLLGPDDSYIAIKSSRCFLKSH